MTVQTNGVSANDTVTRLDGASVTDVAKRNSVSRQTVHAWLRRYANQGLGSLADRCLAAHQPRERLRTKQ